MKKLITLIAVAASTSASALVEEWTYPHRFYFDERLWPMASQLPEEYKYIELKRPNMGADFTFYGNGIFCRRQVGCWHAQIRHDFGHLFSPETNADSEGFELVASMHNGYNELGLTLEENLPSITVRFDFLDYNGKPVERLEHPPPGFGDQPFKFHYTDPFQAKECVEMLMDTVEELTQPGWDPFGIVIEYGVGSMANFHPVRPHRAVDDNGFTFKDKGCDITSSPH